MSLIIQSGLGDGYNAGVNSTNRLMTEAVIHEDIWFHSIKEGLAFAWASGTYDYDAADTILLVENTSTTHDLIIKGIWLSGDTDTRVVIHRPTANVTTAGTTITGRNLNGNSGIVAEANGVRDETGNTQGNIFWSGEIHAAQPPVFVDFFGAFSLRTDQSIGVDYVTDGAACDVTIWGYYIKKLSV